MPTTDLVYRYLGIDAGAGAQFDRMGAKTAALGKTSNATLASVKRLALGVGVLGAAIGVEAVKQAASFQTALTRIHTQADASNKLVGKLRTGILDMTTAVATAPTQLATAAFHIASVGQKSLTAAQQLHILRISAEGAKLGGADLVDVTNALDAAVVSGIGGVKNYSQAMGVLNATVGAGDMTMQNLAEAFGPLGAVMKGYNVNLRQVGAALATFGDNNLRGAEAGTALRMAVQSLSVPIKSGRDQLEAWGIKAGNLSSQLRHGGLTSALDTLERKMKQNGITSKEVGTVLTQSFGKRAGIGLAVLIGELDRYHNKLGEVSKGAHGFASSWAGYTKTFQYAWDRMREAVQKMAIELGTKLLPAATKTVNWIGGHTKVLLIAAGAWAAFRVGAHLATIAMVQFDAAADANPIGAIVLALEAVTAGFIIGYEKSQTFRDIVKRVFIDLATVVGKWAQVNLSMLKYVADAMLSFIGTIAHAASSAFGWIPGVGGKLKGAANDFDNFKSSVLNTLSSLASDAGNLGSYAGSLFASNFISRASQFNAAADYYIKGSGLKGSLAKALGQNDKPTMPQFNLGGGSGVPIPSTSGGGSSAGSTASSLHITASKLSAALAKGLLKGWTGFSQTVEDSLSVGTRHLLNALGRQFQAIQTRMTNLVATAKKNLHDVMVAQRQFVQQMMGDASLSNTPTVDSGFTGQTTRLTNIGVFLGGQARNYAQFAHLLRRLGHSGLAKGLVNQIAQMGPTQGIQYAQQILSGGAGPISQLNAYQKQIHTSAQAIGQDRYGQEIRADRKHLARMVREQRQTNRYLQSLARDTGREVAKELGPLLAKGLTGKQAGLTPHEARDIEKALNRYKRQLAKQ